MPRTEIGSEFWERPALCENSRIHSEGENCRYFISGRTALDYIIKDIKDKIKGFSAAMPSYYCYSMLEPFIRNGIDTISFYDVVYEKDGFKLNNNISDSDVVFVLDYFGAVSDETEKLIRDAKTNGKIIILDTTQSVYCRTDNLKYADYAFCSYRKWFYTNAAYACSKDGFSVEYSEKYDTGYTALRNMAANEKTMYINGITDSKHFLDMYHDADIALKDNYTGYTPEQKEIDYIVKADGKNISAVRRENARKIITELFGISKDRFRFAFHEVKECDSPLFVPILLDSETRNKLRKYLITHEIYCPIHWGITDYHRDLSGAQREIYDTELSLICDQRYDFESIGREVNAIKDFFLKN